MSDGLHTSDLGRRLAFRRQELGLTGEELARRAGMDPRYLEYIEQNPTAVVTHSALVRLAVGLETTPSALIGGEIERPPGIGRPGPRPVLEELEERQCREHLHPGGVGRLVFVLDGDPAALPVNFRLVGNEVVFRTKPDSTLGATIGQRVGFEVDHIDEATSEGWSVLLHGTARSIDDPAELARVSAAGVEPWAGSEGRTLFVAIPIEEITGRRIRQQ